MTQHFRADATAARRVVPADALAVPPGARAVPGGRRRRGRRSYLSGLSAEQAVARAYRARGAKLLETRWRGRGGEIDLIFDEGGVIVFCEVKQARSFDEAMTRLRPAQMRRIHATGSEYLEFAPQGQLSQVRFDLAVVDAQGRVDVREGLFSHF